MAADYPSVTWVPVAQNTGDDASGDFTDALGGDYNDMADEVEAQGADLQAAFAVEGAASIEAMATAMLAANSDARVWLGALDWVDSNATGSWTRVDVAAGNILRRTPNIGNDNISTNISALYRTAASKGLRLDRVDSVYNVTVAAFTQNVKLSMWRQTLNGNTFAPTDDLLTGTFDGDHDTTTKRRAIGEHTAELTVTGPLYFATGTGHRLLFQARETSGGTAALDFYGALLHFTAAPISGV